MYQGFFLCALYMVPVVCAICVIVKAKWVTVSAVIGNEWDSSLIPLTCYISAFVCNVQYVMRSSILSLSCFIIFCCTYCLEFTLLSDLREALK